jgi:hypothetical protein
MWFTLLKKPPNGRSIGRLFRINPPRCQWSMTMVSLPAQATAAQRRSRPYILLLSAALNRDMVMAA